MQIGQVTLAFPLLLVSTLAVVDCGGLAPLGQPPNCVEGQWDFSCDMVIGCGCQRIGTQRTTKRVCARSDFGARFKSIASVSGGGASVIGQPNCVRGAAGIAKGVPNPLFDPYGNLAVEEAPGFEPQAGDGGPEPAGGVGTCDPVNPPPPPADCLATPTCFVGTASTCLDCMNVNCCGPYSNCIAAPDKTEASQCLSVADCYLNGACSIPESTYLPLAATLGLCMKQACVGKPSTDCITPPSGFHHPPANWEEGAHVE